MSETPKTPEVDTEYFEQALKNIRAKLLDTTRRNRLLNYRESARDIAVIDEVPNQIHEHLVIDGKRFAFDPREEPEEDSVEEKSAAEFPLFDAGDATESSDDTQSRELPQSAVGAADVAARHRDDRLQTDHSEKDLERRLKKLYHEHRTIIEETGANNLYLAMGFLDWSDGKEDPNWQKSPLMLVPVRIEREGGAGAAVYYLVFDDEALDTNYSLFEKLRHSFDLELPQLSDDHTPEEYWSEVDRAISTKTHEGWRLAREVSLGLFRFQKQVMWHDLDPSRWPTHAPLVDKDTIRRVLLGPIGGDSEPRILDTAYHQDVEGAPQLPLIREADSSQFSALVDAFERKDGLVIEGPPGTGKSQTITNLIAAAISEGKTVLFVAEKMAALNVVFQRLDERGLGDFCLQLHGLRTGKKELLESVERRLYKRSIRPKNLSRSKADLALARTKLLETSTALIETVGPEGLQLRQVFWRLENLRARLPDGYAPSLRSLTTQAAHEMSYAHYSEVKRALGDLGREWDGIPTTAREAWSGFRPEGLSDSNRVHISDSIARCEGELAAAAATLSTTPCSDEIQASPVGRLLSLSQHRPEDILPSLPAGVPGKVAQRVIAADQVDAVEALVESVEEYLSLVESVNGVFDFAASNSPEMRSTLALHCEAIVGKACGSDLSIGDLPRESLQYRRAIDFLDAAEEKASPVVAIVGGFVRSIEDCGQIRKTASKLRDGPPDLHLYARPSHSTEAARVVLEEAEREFNQLTAELSELCEFAPDRLDDSAGLLDAIDAIETARSSLFAVFSSAYRSARRVVRAALIDPGVFKRDDRFYGRLGKLKTFLRDRDAFRDDATKQDVLGPLFSGVNTDWTRLHAIIDRSQELRETFGGSKAREILDDWSVHAESMEAVESALAEGMSHLADFSGSHPFPTSLWQRPLVEIAGVLGKWLSRVEAAEHELVQPWLNARTSLAQGVAAVDAFDRATAKAGEIQSNRELTDVVGEYWRDTDTQVAPIRSLSTWIKERIALAGMDLELLSRFFAESGELDHEGFRNAYAAIESCAAAIELQKTQLEGMGEFSFPEWFGGPNGTLETYQAKLRTCADEIDGLLSISRWESLRKRIAGYGCTPIVEDLVASRIGGGQCDAAFEFWVYDSLVRNAVNESPLLAEFGRESYERLREEFSKLDKLVLERTADEIAWKLVQQIPPEGVSSGRVGNYTETALLRHEAQKKKRHIPIRNLVARSGNALQTLKPCFLMSPLSVAQFLPPGQIEFDLVVMDEASQIRPEDALGAIARARKAIIVGDPKQLPPTSFFDTASREDEEAEETILDDTESILEVCLKQFPFRRLRWHYRSEHEDLIRFSNERFYDNDLVVFPSPRGDSREFGVHSNFVSEPSYLKGRNRSEAQVVAQAIADHYRNYPKRSLGVAAFNKRQAEEIALFLEQLRREDAVLDRLISESSDQERLFIKNLENVQGDERDVIFVSVTYGPEAPGGRTFQRFGPLNSDVGWRRLNVVITRARQRLEVFTSMRPSDIIVVEGTRRGVRALRDYLEYAETGRIDTPAIPSGGSYESEFEEAVGRLVENLGYEVVPQVGVEGFFIDLGVRHPDRRGEYLLGIECDGATYHTAPSVRDRDRLRQEILESKGWDIHRVWSTSWFHERNLEIRRLQEALDSCLARTRDEAAARESARIAESAPSKEADNTESTVAEATSLRDSLEEFWHRRIRPTFPDRTNSILSEAMIERLVERKPETHEEWLQAIPLEDRERLDAGEMGFLSAVLEVIYEVG